MATSSTLELAWQLIACPSLTPTDAGCLEIIGGRLKALGFACERLDHGPVANLWARHGDGAPLVCFAGHTDVVPTGDRAAWDSDPFVPSVRDGFLYGRGAADMKSSLAAFVTAIERTVGADPKHPGSIALLLTSDEEGDAVDGTVRVVDALDARGQRIDFCIVGEPTSSAQLGDTIKNGRRGSLSGRVVVRGVQGHVAYPHLARNPVHLVAPALAELAGIEWDRGDEYFPPTTWQVSNIHAGTGAGNVIPGRVEIDFNFRFAPASSVDSLERRVSEILDRHGLDYEIAWSLSGNPFLTPRGELVSTVSEAVCETTGIMPALSTSGGTSDGRFIARICPQVVELGPVNATIHQVNECVAVAAMEPLSRIYESVLRRLLRQPRGG